MSGFEYSVRYQESYAVSKLPPEAYWEISDPCPTCIVRPTTFRFGQSEFRLVEAEREDWSWKRFHDWLGGILFSGPGDRPAKPETGWNLERLGQEGEWLFHENIPMAGIDHLYCGDLDGDYDLDIGLYGKPLVPPAWSEETEPTVVVVLENQTNPGDRLPVSGSDRDFVDLALGTLEGDRFVTSALNATWDDEALRILKNITRWQREDDDLRLAAALSIRNADWRKRSLMFIANNREFIPDLRLYAAHRSKKPNTNNRPFLRSILRDWDGRRGISILIGQSNACQRIPEKKFCERVIDSDESLHFTALNPEMPCHTRLMAAKGIREDRLREKTYYKILQKAENRDSYDTCVESSQLVGLALALSPDYSPLIPWHYRRIANDPMLGPRTRVEAASKSGSPFFMEQTAHSIAVDPERGTGGRIFATSALRNVSERDRILTEIARNPETAAENIERCVILMSDNAAAEWEPLLRKIVLNSNHDIPFRLKAILKLGNAAERDSISLGFIEEVRSPLDKIYLADNISDPDLRTQAYSALGMERTSIWEKAIESIGDDDLRDDLYFAISQDREWGESERCHATENIGNPELQQMAYVRLSHDPDLSPDGRVQMTSKLSNPGRRDRALIKIARNPQFDIYIRRHAATIIANDDLRHATLDILDFSQLRSVPPYMETPTYEISRVLFETPAYTMTATVDIYRNDQQLLDLSGNFQMSEDERLNAASLIMDPQLAAQAFSTIAQDLSASASARQEAEAVLVDFVF